jgi:hypothetical protein
MTVDSSPVKFTKPVHRQIPIVVSGTSNAAARRAGLGDGYFSMGDT